MKPHFESQQHRSWLQSKLGLRGLGLLVALLAGCASSSSPGTSAGSGGTSTSTGGSTSGSGGQTTVGGATTTGGVTAMGGSSSKGGTTASIGGAGGVATGTGGTATSGGGLVAGGTTARGGTTSTGGVTPTGGSASGGFTSAGGTTSTGGTVATGGTPSMGGTTATGGTVTTGGAAPDAGTSPRDGGGGAPATGGVTRTGGISPTGGSSRTGGVTSTGGTTATGGTTGGTIGPVTTTCPGAVPTGITSSFCSCDTFASTTTSGFTVYNDVWGSGAGAECVWATTTTKWGVAANHPNTGGVKSYPNISISPKTVISAINTYTSSFDVTVPTGGSWEAAYDIWVRTPGGGGTRIEIMLWMYKTGGVGPISSGAATPATVGGHSWNVYYGSNGGNDVVSFVRTSNTTSGTVDVKAILDWIIANNTGRYGVFTTSWTLDQVQWGFEITSDGSPQAFVNNSFSVTSS